MKNMKEVLSAIHDFYQAADPDELEYTFFPPATEQAIDEAQVAMGPQAPFPDDLRDLYRQYGMAMGLWNTVDVITPREIPETHAQLLEIAAEYGEAEPIGPTSPAAHVPTRIPFAIDADTTFSIDLAPPPGGTPGQIVRLDLELTRIEVVADSLRDFFEKGLAQLTADGA